MNIHNDIDFAIVGGGIVGLSIAHGLLKLGKRVQLFDEGDVALRASRGNFGLVWVQSKGLDQPAYSQWSRKSAASYRSFADELERESGKNLNLVQDGGYVMHMEESELEVDRVRYENLRTQLDGDYPFEVMGNNALRTEEPNIGPSVAGALYCQEDGHLNPLNLLQSLVITVKVLGGEILNDAKVKSVAPVNDGFEITTVNANQFRANQVVLAAGLGAMSLGPTLGFKAPVRPQQGQILITEKLPKLMNRPNVELRQVNEGGVQIGASSADVGLNEDTDLPTVAALARHAVKMYPKLEKAKLIRSWAALRIMSPDGLPIYQESKQYPGAFYVTCHSGITLAAAHSQFLSQWLTNSASAPDLSVFSEDRF